MQSMKDKPGAQIQTAIRLPESLLDRLDRIAARMSKPERRVTRAEVLRMAAFHGVAQLEAEKR
jgi:predicted DNA-binding protein